MHWNPEKPPEFQGFSRSIARCGPPKQISRLEIFSSLLTNPDGRRYDRGLGGKAVSTNKASWGGARPGAGRPKGSGKGPSENARKNRVAVMLSDVELEKLERLARRRGQPVATLAYELLARGLRSAR